MALGNDLYSELFPIREKAQNQEPTQPALTVKGTNNDALLRQLNQTPPSR
jgi:hypothetical protein